MILKLQPILLDKVWGGTKLGKLYNNGSKIIGECWGISGHETHTNIVKNGKFKGMSVRDLYYNNRDLFGMYEADEFPIIVKYIDAKYNLSIQVHPDDEYAKNHQNSKGKEECWYILEATENAHIIIGHSAISINEIQNSIDNNKILDIVNSYDISKNDYFYIPSGTLHSICGGTFLLEVSQSSDITFRMYDYNRLENGIKRELHIDDALEVVRIPDCKQQKSHLNKYFTFNVISNVGKSSVTADIYGDYISILEGEGMLNNYKVEKGDFLIVTSQQKYCIIGKMKYHISRLLQ